MVVLAVVVVLVTRYRRQQHRKQAEKRDVIGESWLPYVVPRPLTTAPVPVYIAFENPTVRTGLQRLLSQSTSISRELLVRPS